MIILKRKLVVEWGKPAAASQLSRARYAPGKGRSEVSGPRYPVPHGTSSQYLMN